VHAFGSDPDPCRYDIALLHTDNFTNQCLAVKSTPQEWGKQGRKLFEQKLYTQAIFCFDKADLPLETALAKAFQLRQKARATPTRTDGTGAETRTEAFSRAGQAFYECANLSSGQSAAKRFSYAAACFVEANNNDRAGDSYLGAGEYDSAAIQYWRAGNFDKSVEVVQKYRSDIAVATWNEVIRIARIYYFREKQLKYATCI
jgi:tetratricopeptide (TPR) repeat protein